MKRRNMVGAIGTLLEIIKPDAAILAISQDSQAYNVDAWEGIFPDLEAEAFPRWPESHGT